jgi:hypothetical protein
LNRSGSGCRAFSVFVVLVAMLSFRFAGVGEDYITKMR